MSGHMPRFVLTRFTSCVRATWRQRSATISPVVPSLCAVPNISRRNVAAASAVDRGEYGESLKDVEASYEFASFNALPMVQEPEEIVSGAKKRVRRAVKHRKTLKNEAKRASNLAARQLDALGLELSRPLRTYVEGFPRVEALHPYDRDMLRLTVGEDEYERVLGSVERVRRSCINKGKNWAARAAKAASKKEAGALHEEGFEDIPGQLLSTGAQVLSDLKGIAIQLRSLPSLRLDLPVVAMVGAPNVGKSSLVQAISTGKPEVQNYPFTTRSIIAGHFYVDGVKYQVTDTPGLLDRNDDERNNIEQCTMAVLRHLDPTVVFVMDLTEGCGTTMTEQLSIRKAIVAEADFKRWIDVFSKCDLLGPEQVARGEEISRGAIFVSTVLHQPDRGVRMLTQALAGQQQDRES